MPSTRVYFASRIRHRIVFIVRTTRFPLPEVRVLGFKGAALSDHFGRPMHKTRDGGNVSEIASRSQITAYRYAPKSEPTALRLRLVSQC